MNKPLPRSSFGAKFDENFDRIFGKKTVTYVVCPNCNGEVDPNKCDGDKFCDKCGITADGYSRFGVMKQAGLIE